MNYLLDTSVFLFACVSPEKLSSRQSKILSDPKSNLLLSIASVWEMQIKMRIGKLEVKDGLQVFLGRAKTQLGLNYLPIRVDHILEESELPNIHSDPFDRLLLSQARLEGVPIITSDKIFRKYKGNFVF
ncbi:type II toxin-antitoxin system VapC family toxin [Leptospira perolatii]|uniref:type II toxin-antitoxin system VapC family toxin n=1 Tax=Leptospira perolatii TaxID=2023191 RepID=UPI0013FD98F6|nr:type II toxin-antitoxin system VapC family toxin [Leptospira perolatii]